MAGRTKAHLVKEGWLGYLLAARSHYKHVCSQEAPALQEHAIPCKGSHAVDQDRQHARAPQPEDGVITLPCTFR